MEQERRRLHLHDQRSEGTRPRRGHGIARAAGHLICVNSSFVVVAAPERRRDCWRPAGSATPFPSSGSEGAIRILGDLTMHKWTVAVLGAAAMSLSVPAAAQDFPLKGGD